MSNYKCDSVGIIGAGIQGVCIGLQLIKKTPIESSLYKFTNYIANALKYPFLAIVLYKLAYEIDKKDFQVCYGFGVLYKNTSQFILAIQFSLLASQIKPKNHTTYFNDFFFKRMNFLALSFQIAFN